MGFGDHWSVHAAKVLTYSITIAAAFFFGFSELKLKRQLTDEAPQLPKGIVDRGIMDDLSERMERERFLRSLPRQRLRRYKSAVALKFLFILLLII